MRTVLPIFCLLALTLYSSLSAADCPAGCKCGATVLALPEVMQLPTPAVCGPVPVPPDQIRDFRSGPPGPMPGPRPGPMPGPRPDFHQDFHPDFHGGGWGGYGGGYRPGPIYVNPLPFVAPLIENYATAPRSILNPNTGQYVMMSPGQWVQSGGVYAWQALAIWPLLGSEKPGEVTATISAEVQPAAIQPIRKTIHFFQAKKPIRNLIHQIVTPKK